MEEQLWWGYKHTSGTYHAKRYNDSRDIEEAKSSGFCEHIVYPFWATNREMALEIVKSYTDK